MERISTENKSLEDYKNLPNVINAKNRLGLLLKNGKEIKNTASTIIYEMLTRRSEYVRDIEGTPGGLMEYIKKVEPQREWYKNTIDKIGEWVDKNKKYQWESNPAWFGINTRPEVPRREGINLKIYTTIPINEYSFIQHLPKLADMLRYLAEESDDIIQVKVPGNLIGFVSNNDSIVVHFKKTGNQDRILAILNEWMEKNNINKSEREMGRSEVAADSKGNSFSNLVADNIATWLDENKGKYEDKLLSELAIKYAIEQSQKPPAVIE